MKKIFEIKFEGSTKDQFLALCGEAFDKAQAEYEADHEAIGAAVSAIFDQYKGVKLNVPALETFVLGAMGVTPSTHKMLTERIKLYLDDNKGERESGKLYGVGKGKGGGIWRWKDQPVKA